MSRPVLALAAILLAAAPAHAADDFFELWLNPTISKGVGSRTAVKLETAQRFRDRGDGGRDTYYFRLWLDRKVGDGLTLSGAVEQRWNDAQEERRLHQQFTVSRGLFRSRSRLEERFVEGDDRMGLRFRQRFGISVPIDRAEKWSVGASAEGFLTLRATNRGGDDGLTGVRTVAELDYEVSDRLALSLGYLRNQDIRRGAPDRVGHAPLIGIAVSL